MQEVTLKKKTTADIIKEALNTPLTPDVIESYKKQGVVLKDDSDYTAFFHMIMGQVQSATKKHNTNAFKEFLQILQKDEMINERRAVYIPARYIAKSFIDVNRFIDARAYNEFVFKGGRFSTKSSFISLKIIEMIRDIPNIHALVVRPYENTLRDSVLTQLRWAISMLGLDSEFKVTTSPMQIVHIESGQTIFLRGADDPSKIKSIKPPFGHIGILWFEELDQFRGEEQIRNVQQSALRGGDVAMVFKSFNPPKSRSSWANKYIKIPKANMYVHHSTYLDVPDEWIGNYGIEEAEHLREVNEVAYRHEYLGEEVGDGTNVFDNIFLRNISDEEINTFDRLYFGQDWGWFPDPNVFVGMHLDLNRRILYIFEEITGNKMSNEQWAEKIKHRIEFDITADSAENKSINDFRAWGYHMHPAIKGPNSVEQGIKWLNSLKEIVIDPVRCPLTAREFTNYEYEKDKEGNAITAYPDKDNHTIDSVRYALERVMRMRGV